MVVFSLVIVSVDATITMVSARTTGLSESTQAIDQLQIAEETITRDVHTVYTWSSAPTASSLDFTASLNNGSPTVAITLTGTTSKTLTIVTNGATTQTLTNLDPASTFTVNTSASWTSSGGTSEGPFYYSVGVTLTMDSPRVSAPRPTKTTVSDPTIIVNNVEYQCASAWSSAPGTGSSPC
jgi:hypothetical protein